MYIKDMSSVEPDKHTENVSGALRLIRDISRKPESAPVLKQKYYQNIAIHEVYLEAVPAVLILTTISFGNNFGIFINNLANKNVMKL